MAGPAFNLIPKSAEHYAENLRAARVLVGQRLGFRMSEGTPDEIQKLSQADQIRFADELSAFIVSQPVAFSPAQLEIAKKRVHSEQFGKPLLDTSLLSSAGELAVELAGGVERKLTTIVLVAVAAAVIGFVVVQSLPQRFANK